MGDATSLIITANELNSSLKTNQTSYFQDIERNEYKLK